MRFLKVQDFHKNLETSGH